MDCGAFVRVRCLAVLGLVACLPPFFLFFLFFAFLFISLPAFCPSPCLLCSGCLLLVLLSCLSFPALFCSFFFPYGLYAKRKGAIPCVLSCPVVSVQILVQLLKNSVAVALAFSSSFGLYSQAIQVASDGLPVLTLIFSGIMSI